MRVLHIIPNYIPAYMHGGPVRNTHSLCKALAAKGLDVVVYTTNVGSEENPGIKPGAELNIDGVKVFYYPVFLMRWYRYSRGMATALKKNIAQFDIVHIHTIYLYPTFIAAYWARRKNVPYIINPSGMLDPIQINLRSGLRKKIYIKIIEEANARNAAALHAASAYEKDQLLSFGFNVPIYLIPRGLEARDYDFKENVVDFKDRYPQLKEKKIILFLGRVHPQKGLALLIEAFSKVILKQKNAYLVIAGPDEHGYTKKLKERLKQLGLMQYVIFTGMLLDKQKLSALYSSNIFVLPSFAENFGLAVIEAMACRLPVVVSDKVGICHDIEFYKSGLVMEHKSDKFADAMLKLLDDEQLSRQMGENGYKLVQDRFNITAIADQMIGAYGIILEKGEIV